MNYILSLLNNVKKMFQNMNEDILNILKIGLKACFILVLISTYILYIYLSQNSQYIFNIGISLFKSAISFICCFVAFSICFNKIKSDIL